VTRRRHRANPRVGCYPGCVGCSTGCLFLIVAVLGALATLFAFYG
jgi:hypothetical protein